MTARRGAARWLGIGLPALLAYVPLLLTQPGQVGADTKTYLYLDPARLLGRAPYLWDEHIGAGTITHQNIGYLWPMGPWYWLFDTLGFPDWVAQRLWLATVLFAAALGIRFLLGTLGWRDRAGEYGVLVASLAYMLSPYLLDYAARISVILLPWAGLPWLVALTARALRRGGWVDGAWFALVVLTVGGINATALIMVAPAVVLWVVNAVWVEREVTGRQALAGVGRLGALTLATSLWWIAGLWAQGTYGLPVLRFTETYKAVADSSTAPEVLRGLGYWFFYGRDKLGPWIEPSVEYTNRTLLLGVSFLLPLLAVVSAAATRWRHRTYFLAVLCVGVLLSVGAHPWSDASPAGALFKTFTRTDSGLALRSTPRAVPLVVLGTAVLLGAGVRALGVRLAARSRRYPIALAALASVLIVANLPPLWNDTLIARNLRRPEELPSYWPEAAAWLDAQDREDGGWATRVLEIPGSDFASYRWGNTVDPITPGLIDRPYLARELFQYGTPASASLLLALDREMQEDILDPDALVPVARLLGVGDIVHRGDLQYERYRTARPIVLAERLAHVDGLDDAVAFGPPNPNVAGPEQPLLDETTLALDPTLPDPSPVTAYPVTDPLPIIRARSSEQPLLLDGGPDGIVDAAGARLLQDDQAIFYAASFADDADGLDQLLADGADLLLTDSNRKQGRRWGVIQQNTGYTERPDEKAKANDPSDQRLVVFPDAPESSFTTSEQRGAVLVTATDYGNPVTYTPDDRPANAVDGDPTTAWRVGAFSDVRGEALRLDFAEPVTTDRLTLLQPITGIVNRSISQLDLVFDEGERVPVSLDEASQALPGQTITFPSRTFQHVTLEIRQTDVGTRARYDGLTGVGLAEVSVGDELGAGPVQEELIHPPSLLLDEVGDRSSEHRLGYVFTRLRANPQEVVRSDEEPWLARAFDVPTSRRFGTDVEARLSGRAADDVIDAILGLPTAEDGGMTVTSGATLPGALTHRASTAFDGDPTTFWMPPFSERAKDYLEFTLPEETTLDHLDVQVVADGRHSVPETAFIRADGDESTTRGISFGAIPDGDEVDGTTTVRVTFPPVTGTTFRLAFDQNREISTRDWYSGDLIALPVGIAEVGVPGHQLDPPADTFDTGCRDDLLTVDGDAVTLRVSGRTADALARRELTVVPCPPADGEVALDAGEHLLRSTPGRLTGIDIDTVALTSDAGGDALDPAAWTDTEPRPAPAVRVTGHGPVDATVTVDGLGSDAWLVLGQSLSPGWSARVEGGPDLGSPTLIDGYANGWRLDADDLGSGPLTIHLEWKPQRVIWISIWLSLAGVLACVAVIAVGAFRRRRAPTTLDEPEPPTVAPFPGDGPTISWGRALAAGTALGVLTVLLAPPPALVALPVMAVTVATLRWRKGARLAAWCASAALAVIAAFYLVEQHRLRHPPDFAWPRAFDAVHILGLLVVLLLLVDVAIAVAALPNDAFRPTRRRSIPGSGKRLMRLLERLRSTPLERLDPARGEPNRHARIPYEPALDGLRGLAVSAVVLYHADIVYGGRKWFGGGFLGVDAFFVLSGFLITALLVVEHQNSGGIALGDFWMRRARRLLPALFLLVSAVVIYAAVFADRTELGRIRSHGLASIFYVANWQFIREGTSYFTQFAIESPFQHVWSLAIEEQWYLIWPLVVFALLRLTHSVRVIMWFSILGIVASAGWMAVLFEPGSDPSRVYFGTDTRAQSLLLGAALSAALISGITVHDRFARHVLPAFAAVGGLAVAAVWVFGSWTAGWYYRGGFLVLGISLAFVIVAAVQPDGNIVRRVLSVRPLVELGIISYGVYLWHWPIFLFLSRRRAFLQGWSFEAITVLRLAATLVVSIASYVLVERPIRHGALRRRIPFTPALLPAAAIALIALLYVSTGGAARPTLSAAEAAVPGPLPTRDDLAQGINPATRPLPPNASTTSATKVLIVGDSVAYSMAGGFTPEIQQSAHLLVWNQTVLFCELPSGPRLENGIVVEPSDTCDDWDEIWRGDVQEFQPEVAVLQVGAWEIFNRKIDGEWLVFGTGEYDRYFLGLLDDAIDALASEGATVVLLTTPHFERADTMSAREWTQNETWRTQHINELFAQAAGDHPDAVLLPFGAWMCPEGAHCVQDLADGTPVREDGLHFTDEGAQVAAQWLAPQLRAIALATTKAVALPTTTTSTTSTTSTTTTAELTTIAAPTTTEARPTTTNAPLTTSGGPPATTAAPTTTEPPRRFEPAFP